MNNRCRSVRRSVTVIGVVGLVMLVGCQHDQSQVVVPLGCRVSSWTPEVLSFYGDPEKVKERLSHFDMKLRERRIYMFVAESADSAELALFERPVAERGFWKIWRWKGNLKEGNEFRERETNEILATQGKQCVGQETEKLVESLNPLRQETNDPPTTASRAFGDVLAGYPKGSYIRATVFLLC